MIQANELRIGNWILFQPNNKISRWVLVEILDRTNVITHDMGHSLVLSYSDIQPIPLTPEILGKCGFDVWDRKLSTEHSKEVGNDGFKLKSIYKKEYKSNQFLLVGNGAYDELGETDLSEVCKNLHQLQNLYFALTNQELEIKL